MIGLLVLDHHSYWTTLGATIKFGSIAFVLVVGAALYMHSKVFYFTTFAIFLAFAPQIILSVADSQAQGICMDMGRNGPCSFWVFLWLSIAMVEIVLVWVPIVGYVASSLRKQPNRTVEADAQKDPARGSP